MDGPTSSTAAQSAQLSRQRRRTKLGRQAPAEFSAPTSALELAAHPLAARGDSYVHRGARMNRVLIGGDHKLLRAGLRSRLEREDGGRGFGTGLCDHNTQRPAQAGLFGFRGERHATWYGTAPRIRSSTPSYQGRCIRSISFTRSDSRTSSTGSRPSPPGSGRAGRPCVTAYARRARRQG
jgi:hypothetical protein